MKKSESLLLKMDPTLAKDIEEMAEELGMSKAETLRYGFRILKTWQQCKKQGYEQLVFKNPSDDSKEKILVNE